jgi:hypothetical protein
MECQVLRPTEIATLRQKLTAAATNKTKSAPALDGLHKRTAALLPGPPTLDTTARTRGATAQVMHGRASESAPAAPEWPRLVAVFIAGELGFVGIA